MQEVPWSRWIPGVLSRNQVGRLCSSGYLEGFSTKSDASDHSSIDLHLSADAYELTSGSVKPSGDLYLTMLTKQRLATPLKPEGGSFLLSARKTYLFKLQERLGSPTQLGSGDFHGQATAKSSIGRLDVLARLIVDGADIYEGFNPRSLAAGNGSLFVEVTPMTFPIIVREGDSLTQLRFFLGAPETVEVRGDTISKVLLPNGSTDGMLSADLSNVTIAGRNAVAFCSRNNSNSAVLAPIDLSQSPQNPPSPADYWDIVPADENQRLQIRAGSFYIIRSYERIAVPKGIAVYCRAIDETIGEIRIHYAGFVHPFFGLERADGQIGTPLIFEVRGHDVNVSLIHREKMAKLIFYRLSEDAESEKPSNRTNLSPPPAKSPYMDQVLQLSKHFGPWPQTLTDEPRNSGISKG
jgi:dCTP deaminase